MGRGRVRLLSLGQYESLREQAIRHHLRVTKEMERAMNAPWKSPPKEELAPMEPSWEERLRGVEQLVGF